MKSRRHLPAYRRRLKLIWNSLWDGVGVAVLMFLAYALVVLANEMMNGV